MCIGTFLSNVYQHCTKLYQTAPAFLKKLIKCLQFIHIVVINLCYGDNVRQNGIRLKCA